jgi:hypothetical protein
MGIHPTLKSAGLGVGDGGAPRRELQQKVRRRADDRERRTWRLGGEAEDPRVELDALLRVVDHEDQVIEPHRRPQSQSPAVQDPLQHSLNAPFRSAIEFGRDALVEWRDLRDAHRRMNPGTVVALDN